MLQRPNERNADLQVWIGRTDPERGGRLEGGLVHRDEAAISPFDASVQNGDAVWEGLRLYDGRVFRLDDHLARLRRGARALAYAHVPADAEITEALRATFAANAMRDGVHARLTLTRGPKYTSGLDPRINVAGCTLIVLAEHKPPVYADAARGGGITLVTSGVRRPPADVLDQRIHSCNQLTSILAKIEANAAGADDALMLDTRGFLAETNATHVFLLADGAVHTSTCAACPEGITRMTVLEICRELGIEAHERDVTPAELWRAESVFVTGTMGEIVPVTAIDGRPIEGGAHAVLERIRTRFAERTAREGTRLVD